MWMTGLIIFLVFLLIGSLVVSHLAYKKEQELLAREHTFNAYRARAEHIQELITQLTHLPIEHDTWSAIINYLVHILGKMKEVKPEAAYLDDVIAEQEALRNRQPQYQVPASDRAIIKTQKQIRQAMRILRQSRGDGLLSPSALEEGINHLSYIHNLVEIDAHLQQGIEATKGKHHQDAVTHLKHAKGVLLRTVMSDSERKQKLDEVERHLKEVFHPPFQFPTE